jgi:hypothetical protein
MQQISIGQITGVAQRWGGALVRRQTARRTPVISVAMVSIWNESSNLRASVSKSHAGAGAGALADALKGHIANELDTKGLCSR